MLSLGLQQSLDYGVYDYVMWLQCKTIGAMTTGSVIGFDRLNLIT